MNQCLRRPLALLILMALATFWGCLEKSPPPPQLTPTASDNTPQTLVGTANFLLNLSTHFPSHLAFASYCDPALGADCAEFQDLRELILLKLRKRLGTPPLLLDELGLNAGDIQGLRDSLSPKDTPAVLLLRCNLRQDGEPGLRVSLRLMETKAWLPLDNRHLNFIQGLPTALTPDQVPNTAITQETSGSPLEASALVVDSEGGLWTLQVDGAHDPQGQIHKAPLWAKNLTRDPDGILWWVGLGKTQKMTHSNGEVKAAFPLGRNAARFFRTKGQEDGSFKLFRPHSSAPKRWGFTSFQQAFWIKTPLLLRLVAVADNGTVSCLDGDLMTSCTPPAPKLHLLSAWEGKLAASLPNGEVRVWSSEISGWITLWHGKYAPKALALGPGKLYLVTQENRLVTISLP